MRTHFFFVAALLGSLFFASASRAQDGWTKDTIHIQTIGNLWDVEFTSANAGVLVGDSAKRTTDGGKTWLELAPAYGAYGQENLFTAVHCFDSSHWVTVGATTFRTSDAGQSWSYDSLGFYPATLRAVHFSGSTGMTVGTYSVIFSSSDGGAKWTALSGYSGPYDVNYFGVEHVSNSTWIVVGGNNLRPGNLGVILRTTDGGGSWDTVKYSPGRVVTALSFANATVGYAAGDSIYRTMDGGATWHGVSPIPVSVQGMSFKDPAVGTLVGSGGKVFRTRDGGVTWIQQQSNTNLDLRAVCFIDTSVGWAVGYRGIVIRTTNGGWGAPSAVGDPASGLPAECTLLPNYPNPFNSSTTITYELPQSSIVRLQVCDMLGREVALLVNERRDAGVHEVKFDATALSSGVYFCRLSAANVIQTRRLLLLR
jgi:photosystem II stability/assembly factor-like uncharacterized protein